MSEITPKYGLKIPAAGGFTQAADIQDSFRKLDEMGQEHNADGTHKSINTPEVNTDVVRFADGSSANTGSAVAGAGTLQDVITAGSTANTSSDLIVRNADGSQELLNISATKGLQGMVGNINDPLVHIPFRRANDELRLSGVQTYACATTSTYIDPLDGKVKTAAIDEPRFERMSNGKIGILLEGASTNLALDSTSFVNEGNNYAGVAGTNNAGTAPDGTLTAWSVLDNVSSYNQRNYTVTADTLTYTVSRYIKGTSGVVSLVVNMNAAGTPTETARVNLATGDTTGTTSNSRVELLPNGWYRLSCSVVNNNVTTCVTQMHYDGLQTNVLGWGAQLEALPFASSYIPTTSAAVNRAATTLTIPANGNMLNIADGDKDLSAVMDVQYIGSTYFNEVHFMSTNVNYTLLFRINNNGIITSYAGATVTQSSSSPLPLNTISRVGYSIDATNSKQTFLMPDGLTSSTFNSSPLSSPSYIRIGAWVVTGQQFYGHISNFRIYDKALTDAEMGAA